jgi:putative two-component system response regulator
MIKDLIDITDANILLISAEPLDSINELLSTNQFYNVESTHNAQAVITTCQSLKPDLIIFSPLVDLNLTELTIQLSALDTEDGIIPVFYLHTPNESIPPLSSAAKDFISTPVDPNEFIYRLSHLLMNRLTSLELRSYSKTILNTVELRNQELKESQEEIIECLGYAAEFRDSETGMHTIRVGHYAQCLAKAMGMSDAEAEHLLYAAPMHDVGKIGIPDKILLKPGRLDGKEWETMKQHTTIGEKILSRSKNTLLQQAGIIAINHHEKWDGTGYPNGLKGTDIHLYGRIVAIVDVFDALTMERPYKKAWSTESALELIKGQSGKHFDPSLVELFINSLPAILEIKDTYTDDSTHTDLLNEYLSL